MIEPSWAPFARGVLLTGIMVSMMVMLSFMLTGDRGVVHAAIAVGLGFVLLIPVGEWAIDRASGETVEDGIERTK